jgi:glycolate dehydrogenase FAD-binding subunit
MARISARNEADVVEAVHSARDAKRTMEIVGAGTKRAYGRPVECDDVLVLSGLSGILKYEPDELVITALTGTPVTEIEAALAERSQRLGFEPADWGPLFGSPANSATIGGALAADTSGSAAIRYGRARDHLLGFRAVNGLGEAYKAGGRVVKNVTGFDLPKLMCGAMGTLGPLTEVTLRVFPKPSASAVLSVGGVSEDEGLSTLRRAWSAPLEATGLVLLSHEAWQYFPQIEETEEPEYDRDWTDEEYTTNNCAAVFRLEGSIASLREKISTLKTVVGKRRLTALVECERTFDLINSGTAFVPTMEDIWLLHLPPGATHEIVSRNIGLWIADWAGGRLWNRNTPGRDQKWLQERLEPLGGRATLARASEETRRRVAPFQSETSARAQLTRAVKAAFDPLRLFNPGRMWEGV